jgi:MacB-like periplasmic core domain
VIWSRSLLRIRRSVRAYARVPGLSFVLLLAIALGVGSNAAVYGFLQGLIHPATPLLDSDRMVSIFRQDRSRDAGPLSPNEYQLLENSHGVFEWVGAVRIKLADTMIGGRSEMATAAAVTHNLAGAVAIPLDKGVVISHRIWESEFGGRECGRFSHLC